MFYIRKDSGNKKRICNVNTLAEALNEAYEYKLPVSLFYEYKGRGVRIYTNSKKQNTYKLLIQDKNKKIEPKIIFTSNELIEIYLKLNELDVKNNFNGHIKFNDGVSEFFRINGYSECRHIIKHISKPLKEYLSKSSTPKELKKFNRINSSNKEILDNQSCVGVIDTIDSLLDKSDEIKYENINLDLGMPNKKEPKVIQEDVKNNAYSTPKSTHYGVVGVLNSGSLVHLNDKSTEYKEVLEKYTESKVSGTKKYKEIRLNGYSEDGIVTTRYKKKLEQSQLSYENVSELISDVTEGLMFIDVLRKDILNAMAVEEKKGNLGYHILEASDFNLSDEAFINNLIEMKVSADKRRDLKKSLNLLDAFLSKVSVSEQLDSHVNEQIKSIENISRKGLEKYKNKKIYDFIQEYDENEAHLNKNIFRKKRLTMRPYLSEGKVVVYKKSHG